MTIKVLAVHQGFELYGSDRSFISTLEILKNNYSKIHLTVVIPQKGIIVEELIKFADELIIEDNGAITLIEGKTKPFLAIKKIFKSSIVARKRIKNSDIVYINTIVPFGYLLAGFFTFKKVIIHIREIPSKILLIIFSFWFKLSRFQKIYNSEATKSAFYFNSKNDSNVLWNGIYPLKEDHSMEKNTDKINLLLLGRFSSWKGQAFFLESFAHLDKHIQDQFKVLIVGDSLPGQEFHKTEIESVIIKYNLNKFVTLFSFDKNPEKYFTWCDVFIVPSIKPEPFGRVAIEAMSLGKPVIASDQGGLLEIIEDFKTGWFFESNNCKDLIRVLMYVLNNKTEISKIGLNANLKFSQNFTLNSYNIGFSKIFSKYINRINKS